MKKGKSRMRARNDIMRANARKERQRAGKSYDRAGYDGSSSE